MQQTDNLKVGFLLRITVSNKTLIIKTIKDAKRMIST